jgi:hypothetical protein
MKKLFAVGTAAALAIADAQFGDKLMSRKEFLSRKLLSCAALGALSLGLAATGPAPAEADDEGNGN